MKEKPITTVYDLLQRTSEKGFTDLSQSQKLSNILRPESADMAWTFNSLGYPYVSTILSEHDPYYICPCWSLAALLRQIPISYKDEGHYCFALINTNPKADPFAWCACYEDDKGYMMFENYEVTPLDACVDMILKLKERKLL